MVDFLNEISTTRVKTSLGQLRGVISGDFGYALPWAAQPIGFAVGTEFRKYKGEQSAGHPVARPRANWAAPVARPRTSRAATAVYEGFGESDCTDGRETSSSSKA
jgi:hypothetical protein